MTNKFAAALSAFATLQKRISSVDTASANFVETSAAAATKAPAETETAAAAKTKEVGTHYTDPTICSYCNKGMKFTHLIREDGTYERVFICWDDFTMGVVPDHMLTDFDPKLGPLSPSNALGPTTAAPGGGGQVTMENPFGFATSHA